MGGKKIKVGVEIYTQGIFCILQGIRRLKLSPSFFHFTSQIHSGQRI